MTQLRDLTTADVAACAALHRRAFPTFFLSQLGEQFLREFYRSFVGRDDALSAVADGDGRIVGVVVGTTAPAGFFKRILLRRWWAFGRASLGLALRHPRHLPRLLRAVLYRGDYPVDVSGALLSSICVEPDAAPGTGRTLLAGFVERVRAQGFDAAYLTTDADDNDRVNKFYIAAGWVLAGTFDTPEGRRMNAYQWRSTA